MYLNKILITTDFSDESTGAFGIALHEANASKSELTLLHVAESPIVPLGIQGYLPPPELLTRLEAEQVESAKVKLQDFSKSYFGTHEVKLVALKTSGSAADAVCNYAKQNKFGLIVTASQGKGALGRIFLGSTTERIIRLAPCPVLVVRAPKKIDKLATGIYKNIVVTTDFSTDSETAFRYAAYEAKINSAKVILVHVVQQLFAPALLKRDITWANLDVDKVQSEYMQSLENKLKTYAKEHFPMANVETKLIEHTYSIANSMIEFAKQAQADLIVTSTHGAGGAIHLLGGVAERILHEACCPVLIVPRITK